MSKLFKLPIKTSEEHTQLVLITTQQTNNDINGNQRHKVQVWTQRTNGGNLWTPKVKGYKLLKDDSYIIQSVNIDEDVIRFAEAFQESVYN